MRRSFKDVIHSFMCHDACLFRQPWFRSPVGVCVGSLPTVYSTPPRPSSTSVSSVQDMPPDYPVNSRGEAGLAPPAPTADYPVQQSSTSVSEGEKWIKTFFFSPGVSTAAAVLSSTSTSPFEQVELCSAARASYGAEAVVRVDLLCASYRPSRV